MCSLTVEAQQISLYTLLYCDHMVYSSALFFKFIFHRVLLLKHMYCLCMLLCPDRIMGLDLPSGGHLTHGFYTFNKEVKPIKQ